MKTIHRILRPILKTFEAAKDIFLLFLILAVAVIIIGVLAYVAPVLAFGAVGLLVLGIIFIWAGEFISWLREHVKPWKEREERKWKEFWKVSCIACAKPLIKENDCVCQVCGTIQNADCVKQGDKVIFYPTSYRWQEDIGINFEQYHYYPGMEMTIKQKVESDHIKDFIMLTVEEVSEKERFCAGELRKTEFVDENMRIKNLEHYLFYWHDKKFEFYEFLKGQQVRLCLSFLTKAWHRNNALFSNLKDGEIYTITRVIKRRYFWLNDIPCNIYWKDVEKLNI